MIRNLLFFTCCFLLSFFRVTAQNAPITIAPVKTACPGTVVSVPVTVTAFNNIGYVSLTLKYNPAVLSYISTINTAGFEGMSFGGATPGKVVASGFSSFGVTYPDNTVLITINFNYIGGTTALTWFDNGISCEYGSFPDYLPLNDIPFANYYLNGQVGPVLTVDFTASNLFPAVNQTIAFSDLTTGGPTAWNWSFSPGSYVFVNGTSAASQNPQVQFTSFGSYNVSLAATKGSCTITKETTGFIHCVPRGQWTGITSASWAVSSNWSNYMVPDGTTDVVIPPSAVHWPVYEGDLTIGSQCKTLTIEGATSMITVTGNLVILPGSP